MNFLHQVRVPQFGGLVSLGSLLGLALAVDVPRVMAQRGEGSPTTIEQFKEFVTSPPVIKNLLFQQKAPMGGGARPLDGSFASSTTFEYFQAKWQTNGLLFRRLNRPEDATNFTFAGNLVSVCAHEHALVEPGGRLTTWDDRDPSAAGKTISVFYTSQFIMDPLRKVLNLGIMYAGIGAVKWDGNRFQTECEVDHERVVTTGELLPAPDGPPCGLKIRYAFPHQTYDYVVRYRFAPSVKYPFLPSVITSFWLPEDRRGTEIEVDEWQILDFETADAPLAAEAFDVAPFARFNHWVAHVYTNGGFYERGTNGALQLAYMLSSLTSRSASRARIPRAVLYLGWGGLNVAIFALMLGAREVNKQKSKEERTVAI